jgi:hypothetical protein
MAAPQQVIREFPYRQNRLQAAFLFLAVSCGAGLLWYTTLHPDWGMQGRGVRPTSTQERVLLLIVAIASLYGDAMLGLLLLSSLARTHRVALTADSIIFPKPTFHWLTREEIELPFAAVVSVDVLPFVGTAKMIRIMHRSGRATIFSKMFPDGRDFEAVFALLSSALVKRDQAGARPSPDAEVSGGGRPGVEERRGGSGDHHPGAMAGGPEAMDRLWPAVVRRHQVNQRAVITFYVVCGAIFGAWQFRAQGQGFVGGAGLGVLAYLATYHLQLRWRRPLEWLKVFGGLGLVLGMLAGFQQQGLGAALGGAFVGGVVASVVGLVFGTAAWLGGRLMGPVERAGDRGGSR